LRNAIFPIHEQVMSRNLKSVLGKQPVVQTPMFSNSIHRYIEIEVPPIYNPLREPFLKTANPTKRLFKTEWITTFTSN
jgi:hypothetical protein